MNEAKTYDVPYRMTNFNHVMVRAKINGKGPFNFIIDTGAPLLYVSTAVGKKLGLSAAARKVKLVPKRKLVGRPRRATVQLVIVATNAAGISSTTTRKIKISR